ncbi:MAG: TetR/AcrR family transcriptional regulator [Lachnospiraceae bacterium]|nr:TetR/AcrR family transcriptional regulator [Lachnospiraceae bacterium]
MRIVKEAEERKNEILDVAARLFSAKGFDNTSTNDILQEVGIARGTLYYHFQSKEEILDAVIERMIRQMLAEAGALAKRKELPVLQRLTLMIRALQVKEGWSDGLMEQIHKPQNALMHQKIQERLLAGMNPLFTGLIEEGAAAGICHTDYPEEVAEMTFLYANTAFDALASQTEEERQRKTAAFIYNLERLLQMEQGSMMEAVLPLFSDDSP